tara:strand:+ start:149 stop:310 length:162 start_codon:yes stop_codon:yes gene_type:complete
MPLFNFIASRCVKKAISFDQKSNARPFLTDGCVIDTPFEGKAIYSATFIKRKN